MATVSDKMVRLEARRAALDLRIRAEATKSRERARREDARLKIIIGGALIALAKTDAVSARALADRVLPLISARDGVALTALIQSIKPADGWAFLDEFAARQAARERGVTVSPPAAVAGS